jgi:hypothetical protein
MSRLDRLAENQLVDRLTKVRQDFDELKATRQTMGSTNVVLQRVVSTATSDFSVVASYNVINIWDVTYTPTSSAILGSAYVWKIFFSGSSPTGSGAQVTFTEFRGVSGNAWTYRFCVIGTTPSQTLSYGVKVILYAMTQGSISVSQIQ